MREKLTTERLSLEPLQLSDAAFVKELVNTEGWLQYIGNRNVNSTAAAEAYVQKIISTENIVYWTIRLKNEDRPVGIITCIKRDYLEHQDIGFALLPAYKGKGYAYEAAHAVLDHLSAQPGVAEVLAITLPHNIASTELLKKLGLTFDSETESNGDKLHVYRIAFT